MKIVKGLLVVLVSYATLSLSKLYLALRSPQPSFLSILSVPASFLILPGMLVAGAVLWLGRTFIANQLSKRIFKAKAGLREELGDFGIAHFPLIFVGLSSMIVFVFGMSNIGIFASLFLGMFFSLLMYAYFVTAVMENSKLNWKKALLVIAITEVIIAIILLFAGLITLHPFMQNGLSSMITI